MLDQLTAIGDRARILDLAEEANLSRRSNTSPIVLYGAGPLGQMTLESLRRIGVLPLAFVDSNPKRWGTTIGGLPILAPEEAIRRYGDEVRFVVTIYNGHDMRRSLIQKGARSVVHFADLYFEHAVELLPYCGLAPRSVVLGAWPEVVRAAHTWHDDRSEEEFLAQLTWRLRLDNVDLPAHDAPAECYFPTDLFRYLEDEVLFDCGAFDGDSLRQYLVRCPAGGACKVMAFEPDPQSFSRLKDFVSRLPPGAAANVRIEPWAVADRSGEVTFAGLGSVRSGVVEQGSVKVVSVAVDDIDLVPTLIKMDVEGYELPALKGAAARLKEHLPVLAISLYHHASDLWTIPNFLKALVPEYHLFLRRYAEDCWELVLYAVPASRLLETKVRRRMQGLQT